VLHYYRNTSIAINVFAIVLAFVMVLQLSGCASDSYASKGARQGAVQGAAAGAVGGLVSALVFGGDPVDRAARGAVYGGAAGAVAGGMSGSRMDKQVQAQAQPKSQSREQPQTQAQQDAELDALRKEIGKPAFNGLAALAECRHRNSLAKAQKARKSKNPNHRLAGLWLEVLNYADLRQQDQVNSLLPVIVNEDWDINSTAEAEMAIREAAAELITIRKDYELPLVCPV
jgi:hypothetical protein